MYFVANLHPNLPKGQDELWLNQKEKENEIINFYTSKIEIPLNIEHKDIGKFGFVKKDDVIGHVIDLFINNKGELMTKCKLDNKHKAYKEINDGIFKRNEKWGVSVGLSLKHNKETNTYDKRLVHVAFTTDPGFGKYNTFLYDWGLNEEVIDSLIDRKYFKENDNYSFATPDLISKLHRMFFIHSSSSSR
jgi:hypothetical protein